MKILAPNHLPHLEVRNGQWDETCDREIRVLDPQMYKFPQMYKTSLKCLKITLKCIKIDHMYKQCTDKCITDIDHNWLTLALSQPQMYKNQPQIYK